MSMEMGGGRGGENKLQWYNGVIDDMSISDNGIRNMNRVFCSLRIQEGVGEEELYSDPKQTQ